MDWPQIISLALLIMTSLGVTIPLHLHMSRQIEAVHEEMKDFHGRLCSIEERGRMKKE